jgi:hypothetical protein
MLERVQQERSRERRTPPRQETANVPFELFKYTLESLRNDTTMSREQQQRIFQAFATIFASLLIGGFVYAGQDAIRQNSILLLILFNIANPAFAIIATVIYLGELTRQGRTAMTLRGLEHWAARQSFARLGRGKDAIVTLFIETFYGSRASRGPTRGYGVGLYYFAILLLFGGSLVTSVVIGTILLWDDRYGGLIRWVALPASVLLCSIWCVITLLQARRIQRLASTTPNFPKDVSIFEVLSNSRVGLSSKDGESFTGMTSTSANSPLGLGNDTR